MCIRDSSSHVGVKGASPARRTQEKSPSQPVSFPRADLRRDLLRWSLCKTFVHQFAVIAKPKPPPQKRRVKRHQGGSGGSRQPVMRRPAIIKRAPGLAAVKHKQQVAVRVALSERHEKASSALASVQ